MECRRGRAMRILSVRPSVKRLVCDKTQEKICPFSLVFREKEWLMGRPLQPKILEQPAPVGAKSPILNRSLVSRSSASAVTPSEKVQLTLIGSCLLKIELAIPAKRPV